MDLALEFGMPFEQLARQMTEREFRAWGDYANRRMLPARRMEMHLAQITKWIAMTMGGERNVSIADFLIEPRTARADATIADLAPTEEELQSAMKRKAA